jgi:hypothetical protein
MTFNPAAAQCILQILEHAQLPDRDLAIDFGSQRYTAQRVFDAENTRDFYHKNGFRNYTALDINDDKDTCKRDLNDILNDSSKCALVTNIGTGEHIFDQCSVFTNMHNLCKVGGVMFFHLPFTPWLNHGFYNYNPILFTALAYANKYDLLMLQVGDREGNVLALPFEEITKEKGQQALEKAAKEAPKPLFVYCAFRKKLDQPFKKPFQGKYVQDIKDDAILQRYV